MNLIKITLVVFIYYLYGKCMNNLGKMGIFG